MHNEPESESESEATQLLRELFARFDREVDRFTRVASLSCPAGCGDCCDHADTEVTIPEARLIARHIQASDTDLITHIDRELADPDRVACVFYNPDSDLHCRIYQVRPLICRSFGYSAYSDRSGNKLFAICPSMPIAKANGGVMQILFEPYPPVVEHYAEGIAHIARTCCGSTSKRPLARAVQLALEEQV